MIDFYLKYLEEILKLNGKIYNLRNLQLHAWNVLL